MDPSVLSRLYFLDCDLSNYPQQRGRILSCLTDGSELRTIVDNLGALPDGIAVDRRRGHMYWTNMGISLAENNGSIERANLDGSERTIVVPEGTCGVHTPKQIVFAERSQKLYWCDREGMKVMRCDLDGSNIETLISTGSSNGDRQDRTRWCVGIAVDESDGYFYWTQKGPPKGSLGCIYRASINTPIDQKADNRSDIEILLNRLPEPIDLHLDTSARVLYWTDRGNPPAGNSLNRASLESLGSKQIPEQLAKRLHEGIGLVIDEVKQEAYVTDLAGGLYVVNVNTKEKRVIFPEIGDLTGITLV